jgi:hypothetical protein
LGGATKVATIPEKSGKTPLNKRLRGSYFKKKRFQYGGYPVLASNAGPGPLSKKPLPYRKRLFA